MALACLSQSATETGSTLANNFVGYAWGQLKCRISFTVHYKKKVEKLNETFDDLKNKRNDLQRRADAAERNGEVVDDVVFAWLNKVKELEMEVGRLSAEVREAKRWFKGYCPDFAWQYNLGKKATEKIVYTENLKENGSFETVSQLPPPAGFEAVPGRDFMAFGSTKDAMYKVLEAMRDEKQQLIGIYGMGGVGKTTLMEELGRQFSRDKEFGTVVKVVVSQNPIISQVRRDIADELGMRHLGDGQSAAGALATRLKKETKIVIMMDDIWDRIELRDVGIPTGDEHMGCKILFTTRTKQACQVMESHASILVDVLNKEDSWILFKSKVGDVSDSSDIEPIARDVAGECGGLPLAIVVVGRALRGCNTKSVWESAKKQLKRSIPTELTGVENQLFKSLELSYKYINSPEMKLLFLFCCLFREDYDISEDDLTRYAVGEGFLSNAYTLDEARSEVHLLVQGLVDSCLLLSTENERHVKMHDVVRDVAVYIASKEDNRFFVKAGLGMIDWPETKGLELCKRISLMNNDIRTLPDQPNCPKLITLLLNLNPSLCDVPMNFFYGMASLAVLDLSGTDIKSLPSSLASLTNLGALRLDRCKNLEDISLIGKLKRLKVLGLRRCAVDFLPEELGNLTDLRLLDISNSASLEMPPNLICKLFRLEELFMVGHKLEESLFLQIGSLKRLTYLQVCASELKYFSLDVEELDGWRSLRRFTVYVGLDWISKVTIYQKNLYLKNVSQAGNWTRVLLTEAEDLILDDCDWDVTGGGNLINVKKLHLANRDDIDCLLNAAQIGLQPKAFAELQNLHVGNLAHLEEIYRGEVPALSFNKLRLLDILRCKKLLCIMPSDLLQRAHRTLEILSINSCDQVHEIFNSEGILEELPMLPELKSIKLASLPNLTRLWGGIVPRKSLRKLSALQIFSCNKLEQLLTKKSVQSHRMLFPPGTFASLKELSVVGCSSLKHLLLPSLTHELRNLVKLTVKKNQTMEVIVEAEDGVALDKGVFPRLKELELMELEMLDSFYRGEPAGFCFDWPLMEQVKLDFCPNMKRFPIGVGSAPKLKKIQLGDDDDVEWFKGLEWEDTSVLSRFDICTDR